MGQPYIEKPADVFNPVVNATDWLEIIDSGASPSSTHLSNDGQEASKKKGHDDSRVQLIHEGTRSYLEAATALIAFQREIQKQCRKAMETQLEDYAAALKVKFNQQEIRDTAWPTFANWEGDYWGLGVEIVRRQITPRIRWWECYRRCARQRHVLSVRTI